nr:gamma-glutamyltransferase [Terriglobales bacterium]
LSSMTPTIVTRDGKLFMVLGSPGGARIITTVANVLMGVTDYGLDLQEAVNAPRFHQQWLPDVAYVEQWFSPDTVSLLRQMGYKIEFGSGTGQDWRGYWSDAECAGVDPVTGERLGASDPRNNGKAVGY